MTVAGRAVALTATEYEPPRVLSLNAGRVVPYASLLRQVWDNRASGDSDAVRTFVKKLRDEPGDNPASPTYIFNQRGVGYRMAAPHDP